MPRRKKSSSQEESKKRKSGHPKKTVAKKEIKVRPEEIAHLHAMLDKDDEQEMEKEIRQALKERRRKIRHQASEMEDHNKRLIMWVGITVVMLIVVSFWAIKFNEIVSRPIITTVDQEIKDIDFEKAKQELTSTMNKVKAGIEEIKQEAEKLEQQKNELEGSTDINGQITEEGILDNQIIE